jgi:glycosyltransferase involved in cell wall biosynthesis
MYNEADILVFGSKFEGFGYPPLEAMACGTPVVTTNCAGVSEYAVHAVNAYVALDDREHVAKAISTLLCNPSLYNRLVEGGLETARKFDFEKVVDRFESCIS